MKGMTPDETASYIRHHLEAAGRTADLFTDVILGQSGAVCCGRLKVVGGIGVSVAGV
jgi:hypothetical protein